MERIFAELVVLLRGLGLLGVDRRLRLESDAVGFALALAGAGYSFPDTSWPALISGRVTASPYFCACITSTQSCGEGTFGDFQVPDRVWTPRS